MSAWDSFITWVYDWADSIYWFFKGGAPINCSMDGLWIPGQHYTNIVGDV